MFSSKRHLETLHTYRKRLPFFGATRCLCTEWSFCQSKMARVQRFRFATQQKAGVFHVLWNVSCDMWKIHKNPCPTSQSFSPNLHFTSSKAAVAEDLGCHQCPAIDQQAHLRCMVCNASIEYLLLLFLRRAWCFQTSKESGLLVCITDVPNSSHSINKLHHL